LKSGSSNNDNWKVSKILLEHLNETLLCGALGRCREVKIIEAAHRYHWSMNRTIDFINPKKGEVSRATRLVQMRDCRPYGFAPFDDNDLPPQQDMIQQKIDNLVPEELKDSNAVFLPHLPDVIREFLQTPVSQDLLRLQIVTLGFFLRDEIVIVEGNVPMLCSRSHTQSVDKLHLAEFSKNYRRCCQ
jgi:hypothetical protein